jgi:hypothetical protein
VSPNNPPIFATVETTAFSGATLLTRLLGAHPAIATVAEMSGLIDSVNPDEYFCSCGQKIKECGFWRSVKDGMLDRGFEFDVADFHTQFISGGSSLFNRLRQGSSRNQWLDMVRDTVLFSLPAPARYFREMTNRNKAFIETVLEITGKQVFVDSSKDRLRPKALQRFSSLDVRIIHLVRDVRGVVASQLRRDAHITAAEAARAWRQRHRRVEITLASWPKDKQILVRYEDLCINTEGILKQLYNFFGVNPDYKIGNEEVNSQHLIGNPMRLTQVSKIDLDERWKNELTSDQLKEIELNAGALGRKHQYFMNEGIN